MRFTSIAVVLSAAAAAVAQLTIQTPASVNQCQPVLLNFSGGTPPYIVTVQPQGQLAATPLATFPTTSANSLTWNVALVANTLITLEIRDATGATQASGPITVGTGTGDTSCLNGSASQGSTAVAGSTAPASSDSASVSVVPVATTTSVAAATTTAAVPVATTTAAGVTTAAAATTAKATTTATTAKETTTTKASGASQMKPLGLAGLLAIVGFVALF